MTREELKELLLRYEAGEATEEEKAFLASWYMQHGNADQLDYAIADLHQDAHSIWENIEEEHQPRRSYALWKKIAVAAVLLIALSISLYVYKTPSQNNNDLTTHQLQDVVPGGNQATLILADGKEISLTDATNGELARQAGMMISKTADGQIVYTVLKDSVSSISNAYNVIKTPNGGQYQVRLPDGSIVWLNSASSIKYPASLASTKERRIELDGEAYFEVAKDQLRPFLVVTRHQVVRVLGTQFNVNSYRDETITTTTLIEGSVKIFSAQRQTILQPKQQAVLNDNFLEVKTADLEEAMAWKNGYFRFNNEKIEEVTRKLSRWYDVEFAFDGKMPEDGFNGMISRSKNLSQVLKLLERTTTIHFKKEGRTIIVRP